MIKPNFQLLARSLTLFIPLKCPFFLFLARKFTDLLLLLTQDNSGSLLIAKQPPLQYIISSRLLYLYGQISLWTHMALTIANWFLMWCGLPLTTFNQHDKEMQYVSVEIVTSWPNTVMTFYYFYRHSNSVELQTALTLYVWYILSLWRIHSGDVKKTVTGQYLQVNNAHPSNTL